MTPADHYREAERLLDEGTRTRDPLMLGAAQVHATLATAVEAHQEAAIEEYART